MCAQWFVRAFLIVWAVSLTAVGACLMVSHWVPLPQPDTSALSSHETLRRAAAGQWTAFHILYAECPCSRRVLEHLIALRPRSDIREQIVLVGGDAKLAARITKQGFPLNQVAPEQLKARYGIEAAPLLVVVDPEGRISYSGGYTDRKQALEIQSTSIISSVLVGNDVEPLPAYGCAVSKRLQAVVDPLGIKPSSRE